MSVLAFPKKPAAAKAYYRLKAASAGWPAVYAGEPNAGVVLILPVVRVDRDDGTPAPHRRRRGRGDGE